MQPPTTGLPRQALRYSVLVFFAAVVVALIFRAAVSTRLDLTESTDFTTYYKPVALALLNGDGFITPNHEPAIRYMPGYPLILAGVFGFADLLNIPEPTALATFILIGTGLAAVLVFRLASSIWEPRLALIATVLWVTYPFALIVFWQANTALPFIVVFYGALLLFWTHLKHQSQSPSVYLACGVLLGMATLIRPTTVWIGLLFAGILIGWLNEISLPRRLLLAGLLLTANLVTILPWQLWVNSQTTGSVLLTTGGVPSIRDGLVFAAAAKDREEIPMPADVLALQQSILDQYADLRTAGDIGITLWEQTKEQPLAMLKLMAIKAARSWYGTDSQQYDRWIRIVQLPYLVAILWGLIAAKKHDQSTRRLGGIILLIGLYFWGMTVLVLSILRYMMPAIGLLFILVPAIFTRPVDQNIEANHAG